MTSVSTAATERNTARSRTCKPVHGTTRLLRPCEADGTHGVIAINGVSYRLDQLACVCRLFSLTPEGAVKVYDLPRDLSSCTCKDAQYRDRAGGCKHRKALSALRAKGKIA